MYRTHQEVEESTSASRDLETFSLLIGGNEFNKLLTPMVTIVIAVCIAICAIAKSNTH